MIKLLNYFLKKRLQLITIVSVILAIIVFIICYDNKYVYDMRMYDEAAGIYYYVKNAVNLPFDSLRFLVIILAIVIPILEFSFKMKKISIDQMYSLPIKREKLYITKYLVGLIEIIIPITISFLFMVLLIICKENLFKTILFIPYYFGLIILTTIIYTLVVFIFTRCNTVIDGVVLIGLYSLVFLSLFTAIKSSVNWTFLQYISNFSIFTPLKTFNDYMGQFICNKNPYDRIVNEFMWSLIIEIILLVIMTVLFFVLLKKQKAEDAEQISNSYFGYNLMIPLYLFSIFTMWMTSTLETFAVVLIFVGPYVGYIIKNRSFKPKKMDLILTGVSVVCSILFVLITGLFR